jgi:hypothetical protein
MEYHEIKFSKKYKKLPPGIDGQLAYLILSRNVMIENQTPWLLNYDTEAEDGTHYELPAKGEHLLLMFDYRGAIFTTLRRRTLEKERYYRGLVGQLLRVVITGD